MAAGGPGRRRRFQIRVHVAEPHARHDIVGYTQRAHPGRRLFVSSILDDFTCGLQYCTRDDQLQGSG